MIIYILSTFLFPLSKLFHIFGKNVVISTHNAHIDRFIDLDILYIKNHLEHESNHLHQYVVSVIVNKTYLNFFSKDV